MTNAVLTTNDLNSLWSGEPASRIDHARIRARIGGLHCSLCTGTIEKALGRMPGVQKVAVSLTHEQALVEFDPHVVRPEALLQTLRDIGYTIHDPRKLRPFEEEERELVHEGRRFLVATALSLLALALIVHPTGAWSLVIPAIATLSLMGFVFLVLRASGLWTCWLWRWCSGSADTYFGWHFRRCGAASSTSMSFSKPAPLRGFSEG